MKKSKPTFTKKNWIHLQIALLCLVVGVSVVFNVVSSDDGIDNDKN